ncbi:MAG: Uma2 family endonuclease, partial [Gemmatimonadetes bacterium]|nr:Uma2 family endonuclease [Gemmatimonadota bacterium]
DSVWIAESDLKNSDWKRCLQLYDKIIEKTIAWGYPHLASAAARGKAIIHDEYLQDPDAAHEVLQDIILKVGSSTVIEEAQAVIYSNNKYYRDALEIYERILPKWNPSLELELNSIFLERYRRAGICAAHLDDWEKAATFFEEGAKKSLDVGNTKRYIGFYADVGFAQFKSSNLLSSIKLLKLALQELEKIPQDNTDVIYFTLKKRLGHTIAWLSQQIENKISIEEDMEPPPGCCSDPEVKEKILNIPDYPIGYSWLCLAQIEYKFELETTAFQHAWNTTDREEYPPLNFFLLSLKTQYDLRNKTFDDLPHLIYQLAYAYASFQRHSQNEKGIGEKGVYFVSIDDLSNFASIYDIIDILVAALLIQLSEDININKTLVTWRTNSLELPIKENMIAVLDLIEQMLLKDKIEALKTMKSQESKREDRLTAALKTIHNTDTDPTTLFYAHTLVATDIIDNDKYRLWGWEENIIISLSDLLSRQWLEKIKFQTMLNMPRITVPDIEQACNSSETGKKKMGQILLAASQAVSITVPPSILQNFRSWIEDVAIPEPTIKFTYEDYLNTPEDKRYELLDGELVMAPAPGELHQSVSAQLGWRLVQFVSENNLGRVYQAPFDVVLSNINVVQPDLLFVSNGRDHIITSANIQGAPDLVVEILSPSTAERDRTFKRTLYANHGVNEYWMVDTTAKDITILLLGERGYEVVDTYGEGETLTSPTLQGFTLNIGDIF